MAQDTARIPVQMIGSVVPGGSKDSTPDPAALQAELFRLADDFSSRSVSEAESYAREVGTAEAVRDSLRWRLMLHSAAVVVVTGPNPVANLVDFIALTGLSEKFVETQAANLRSPALFEGWLASCRSSQTNAWSMAGRFLTPAQIGELRPQLAQWLRDALPAETALFDRPHQFTARWTANESQGRGSGSMLGWVGLDPTSGLDPAVREVTRSRMFAERALFVAQRIPFQVRWQTELLAGSLTRDPQVTNAVQSVDRLSRAAESASRTAAELPDRLTSEREAILSALEQQEGRLRELSAEVGHTLSAGEKMSVSLNTTIQTFDALMKRFGVGEPDRRPRDTNAPPFNILDYARTAEQIAAMATQLDSLIRDASGTMDAPALDRRVAELKALPAQAKVEAISVLNHAFLLLACLVLLVGLTFRVCRRAGCSSAKSSVPPSA